MFRQLLLLAAAVAVAAGPGIKGQYIGGTLASIAAKSDATLDLTAPDALTFRFKNTELRIGYGKINTLEYGQNVSRRYAAAVLVSPVLLLSKSRKHFVTIGYEDAEGKQQAMVFRIEKGDIRWLLTSLEARTGRRIEYQDNEARKSGKG